MTDDRFESVEGETAMTAEDRALWQKARNGWTGGSQAADDVDPLLLAAYLDGELDADEAAALEARLAADPVALDLIASSREALAAGPADAVPETLLRRAEGLVRPAPVAPRKGLLAGLAAAFMLPNQAAWAGFAAALMLASLAGFELGQIGLDNAATVTSALGEEVRHGLDPLNGPLL